VAVDQTSLFDHLGHLTLANDFLLKRPHEKKAVGHALWKPHRNRLGIRRRGHKAGNCGADRDGYRRSLTTHKGDQTE